MKRAVLLAVTLGSLLLTGCCTTHRATAWEYKTLVSNNDTTLNAAVAEGWGVIGFSASDSGNRWFLLKRPKQGG